MKFIVTAGGQGTKLWPLSREDQPKQFQQVIGQESLYQYTIKTLLERFPIDDIFVSTKDKYVEMVLKQTPNILKENIIIEPNIAKNRGPAEGLAFLVLSVRHPNEPFMIVQADCLREPKEKYLDMIVKMEELVKRDKQYITGGIKASASLMGVDYLRLGRQISDDNGINVYKVDSFVPRSNDYYETKKLVSDFEISTHCNHGCWYPDLMLEAYKKYAPDWYNDLMRIKDVILKTGSDTSTQIEQIYSEMRSGATEEVTKNIFADGYVILLPFEWTDIGTWDAIFQYLQDKNKIYVDGQGLIQNSKNVLIKSTNEKKLIAVKGLENIAIIDTGDVLLVTKLDESGNVKDIITELKEKGNTQYI